MRAASYSEFGGLIRIGNLPDPTPAPDDVVIAVQATGLCASDWHGWRGHDPDIVAFPHVPGHEFAGVVAEAGAAVERWRPGDRVAVPFVAGCGRCATCAQGDPQICPDQTQPGFTHWGSFAERVLVRNADANLVRLPDSVDAAVGAALGCRFSTAYRAVVDRGQVAAGQTVAVYGCGGVGLSAIMIASSLGARPIGVDPRDEARVLATEMGAEATMRPDVARTALAAIDGGGPHVTIDAVGSPSVVADAVNVVRRGGRHVQVGLLPETGSFGGVIAARVVGQEITIAGSHGIAASGLADVLGLVAAGQLDVGALVRERVDLATGVERLTRLGATPELGITVITQF